MKWIEHLKTINHHKWLVMQHCFKVGLYRQGLMHDLSKYSPVEFSVGAKYYVGTASPNNEERRAKGYSSAWLHHKGRNKHHLEYWIDYGLEDGMMTGMEMPVEYVIEMFCDRVAASKNYLRDAYTDAEPYKYYMKSKKHYIVHRKSAALLEKLLIMLKYKGEDYTFAYIRRVILHKPPMSKALKEILS